MPVDFLTQDQAARYGRYTDEPSSSQLARSFYLDATDLALIQTCRDDHTRLGMALHICTARFLGTFLTDPTAVPAGVIAHLATQLGIADTTCLNRYSVHKTHLEHTAAIRATYVYHTFTAQPHHFRFLRWLYARAWLGTDRPSVLFDRATSWLVFHKILLPGATVLERTIAEVRAHASTRMWRLLAQTLTLAQRNNLDTLLTVPSGARMTVLETVRRAPTLQSSVGLVQGLDRVERIRGLGMPSVARTRIPPSRLAVLARFAMTARAQALARMPTDRRMATLLAFVQYVSATAHDDVLDIFAAFMTTLVTDARRAGLHQRVRTLKDLDAVALQLATIGAMVLDPTFAAGQSHGLILLHKRSVFSPLAAA